MKKNYFIWVGILFVCLSCNKQKRENLCKNSFAAWESVAGDSVALTEVSSDGLNITNSPFPQVPSALSCYNKNDHCVYCLVGNDKLQKIYLYKFDLVNTTTDIYPSSGNSVITYDPNGWSFSYNNVADKFYLVYWNDFGRRSYPCAVYEIAVSGKTFVDREISLFRQYDPLGSPGVNETTGEMYFTLPSIRYAPGTSNVTIVPADKQMDDIEFNPNDGLYYGTETAYPNGFVFCKRDVQTGATTVIAHLPAIFSDGDFSSTFDACNNQYILKHGKVNTNIYWLDVKTGATVKHIATSHSYLSLTYIPG